MSDSVVRAMARKLDHGFYLGSGTAPEILGLFNKPGLTPVPAGGALTTLAPFIDAIAALEAADLQATATYMHPKVWAELMGIPETTGSNVPVLAASGGVQSGVQRSLLGVPVFTSSQLPLDTAAVAAADQIVAVRRQEARVETSADVKFREDVVALRCISRWDIASRTSGRSSPSLGSRASRSRPRAMKPSPTKK